MTLEVKSGKGHYSKHGYKVFTERGLYMLATILKGERAVRTTLAIIETYAQVRAMVRDMKALQSLKDGSVEQASKLSLLDKLDDNESRLWYAREVIRNGWSKEWLDICIENRLKERTGAAPSNFKKKFSLAKAERI